MGQIENSQDDYIISQILSYMIDTFRESTQKDCQREEILAQLVLRKYQIRQDEESKSATAFKKEISELNQLLENMESKMIQMEEENNLKFDLLDG